jgi:hypothetical protein
MLAHWNEGRYRDKNQIPREQDSDTPKDARARACPLVPAHFHFNRGCATVGEMIHENLSQSIENLSSRIIAIRDSL